jgi:hypothetical protein
VEHLQATQVVNFERVYGVYGSLADDKVVAWKVANWPLVRPPNLVEELSRRERALSGGDRDRIALLGIRDPARRNGQEFDTVDVECLLEAHGRTGVVLHMMPIEQSASAEAVELQDRVVGRGRVRFLFKGRESLADQTSLPRVPLFLHPRGDPSLTFHVDEGKEIILPSGKYSVDVADQIVRRVIDGGASVSVTDGCNEVIVIGLQEAITPVQFHLLDASGMRVRRAQVDIEMVGGRGSRRFLTSRQVLDLQTSWFWVTEGAWTLRVFPPRREPVGLVVPPSTGKPLIIKELR